MWSNKYIGIPYQEKGRDENGIDCWGLVRLIYKQEYDIDLPSFVNDYAENDTLRIQDLIAQYKEGWAQLEQPEEGCVVLFRILGTESHIGVAISATHFVHARENYSSAVESFDSTSWKNRIIGYFKYSPKSSAVLNVVPHPLRTERYTVPVVEGTTLEELVTVITYKYEIAEELKPKITIIVNGRVVDKADWPHTVLKSTDTIEYRAVAAGSGGGIFRLVAVLAIAVFAPEIIAYIGGYSSAAVAATEMGSTLFTAARIGVSLVGSLLVNAIAPVRMPTSAAPETTERQLMITGAANQANRYGAIPVILGKIRLTPPLGASNFITYQNERDTYLTMMLAWGYGPITIDETTLKIGDVALSEYTLAKFTDDVGTPKFITLDRKTTPTATQLANFNAIYGNDVQQVYKGLVLACPGNPEVTVTPGPWSEAASTSAVNQLQVAIHFPQGLRKISTKSGGSDKATVQIALEVKLGSATTWSPWKTVVYGNDAYKKDAFTVTETLDVANQYAQIRVRRETGTDTDDNADWRYQFECQFLAATFIKNTAPAVDPKNCTIAKSAIQIQANDQLNGSIEGINAVVQTYCLSWNGTAWVMANTSNPADLYRYVLQHPANPQRILDSEVADKIDLVALQHWHDYCNVTKTYVTTAGVTTNYKFEYNAVMASQRSVLDTLRDICAAGRASPSMIDGKWSVLIDEPKSTVVQHFTTHNSWGFEGTRALPKLPDGLRVNYFDEDQNYQEAEIIVYAPGKTQDNAELFESISVPGVTKIGAVVDHARWHMAQAQLRRESYILNTDIEYIVCNRGDRVKVTHDVPMWGLGSGRIKNRISDSIFELDDTVPMKSGTDYTVRVRTNTGASIERTIKRQFTISSIARTANVVTVILTAPHPLSVGDSVIVAANNTAVNTTNAIITAVTSVGFSYALNGTSLNITSTGGTVTLGDGYYDMVQVTTSFASSDALPGDLYLFGEYQNESQDLIIINIEPTTNKSARLTLVDYGVNDNYNIFTDYLTLTANTVFETKITKPPELLQNSFGDTDVPIVTKTLSDDSVADIISPGTYAYNIKISYANSSNLPNTISSVECQYDISSSTNSANYRSITVPFQAYTIKIPNVIKGEIYKYRLRYTSTDGRTGVWSSWYTHTVNGKQFNYNNVDTVLIKRVGRYISVIPSMTTLPDDFKFYEVRVFKDSGTGDFWDSSDASIIKTKTTSTANIDLKQFAAHRISATGVKYRVAVRTVNTVGNYSTTSLLGDITLTTITP
jgi:sulfur carrier protein ThiS